ncbi:unnamed protein product [Fraxinus pennsylvanica]|uniref:SBP-type domain-containing protein n=1 Tax=Fraxinus pennsylvanica TaxID=56036 RepID=A0AAD2A8D4_9LAMI|nr:unnamed protein product [Fraxinus pennsylvanica]
MFRESLLLIEWNSKTATGSGWDCVEPIEITQQAGASLQEIARKKDMDIKFLWNGFEGGSSSRSPFVSAGSLPVSNKLDENFIGVEKISGSSGKSIISSELGKQKVHGLASSIPVSTTATKRWRASYQKMQNPSCQVEGYNLDLALAKDYHRHHRICENHSKSPKVIVAGMERRFHGLSKFDDKKRSCRRRLSDHNARRRRLQPKSIHFSSSERTSQNVLFDVLPISLSNRMGENICSSMLRQADNSLVGPSKTGGTYRRPCLPNHEIPSAVYSLHVESERLLSLQSTNPQFNGNTNPAIIHLYPVHVLPVYGLNFATNSAISVDLPSASSLLSIDNPWSSNRDESTSMKGLLHGNASVDNPNWPFVQSAAEEGPSASLVLSTNLNHSGSSFLKEFDLFKTPHDSR